MNGGRGGWHPTSVRFSPEDLGRLDALAGRTGYSRNEVIRLLVRIGLRVEEIAPKDRRAAVEVRPPPDDGRAAAAA